MTQPAENEEINQIVDSFDNMNLREDLLRGIYSYEWEKPSYIQQRGIMAMLQKRDIIIHGQAGTGKTGTFLIASLQMIDLNNPQCQILILAPHRETARQTYNAINLLSKYMDGVTWYKCIGGMSVREDIMALKKGQQIVVGTPGRINDMISRGVLKLKAIKLFVLDDTDEMFSRGFKDIICSCIQYLPSQVQIGLVCHTMPNEISQFTQKYLKNPVRVLIKREELTLDGIKQYYVAVENEDWKLPTLFDLYEELSMGDQVQRYKNEHGKYNKLIFGYINQHINMFNLFNTYCHHLSNIILSYFPVFLYKILIFVNTKRKAMWLRDKLQENRFKVSCIDSSLSPKERDVVMKEFDGIGYDTDTTKILISTDLLSPGIKVQNASFILNYDLSIHREYYIHRIGRSGCFGRKGVAINFVADEDEPKLRDIEIFYNTRIDSLPMEIDTIFH